MAEQAAWTPCEGNVLIPVERAWVRYTLPASDELSLTGLLLLMKLETDETLAKIAQDLGISEEHLMRELDGLLARRLVIRHQARGRLELTLRARELVAMNRCVHRASCAHTSIWVNLVDGSIEDAPGIELGRCHPRAVRLMPQLSAEQRESLGATHHRQLVAASLCDGLDPREKRAASSIIQVSVRLAPPIRYRQVPARLLPCLIGGEVDDPKGRGGPTVPVAGMATILRLTPRCDAPPEIAKALALLARENPEMLSERGTEVARTCQAWEALADSTFLCVFDHVSGNASPDVARAPQATRMPEGARIPDRFELKEPQLRAALEQATAFHGLPQGIWLEQADSKERWYGVEADLATWLGGA